MTREEIKAFWRERAKAVSMPRSESLVNFENNKQMADLRVDTEIALINTKLQINANCTVVDLGAGNGRFTMLFAPKARKITAVEYINDFTNYIMQKAEELHYANIEVINMPAENYCNENYADIVFISGLLHYLDQEQYIQVVKNMSKTLKFGGTLFLRETISVLKDEFIVDKFSEELCAHYCSIYRTSQQHIDSFCKHGFRLKEYSAFFDDSSLLNKRLETRLYYFIFIKTEER